MSGTPDGKRRAAPGATGSVRPSRPLTVDGGNRGVRRSGSDRVVAITGATSSLGRELVSRLEEDERVRRIVVLDADAPRMPGKKTELHAVDLTEPSADETIADILDAALVDTIVHLAFLSSPAHAIAWAHEFESVGTMHLLNAARRADVRKIVMQSQTLLYGALPTNPNYLTEQHPLRARKSEPFFADKIEAEAQMLGYGDAASGRIVTVLRTAPILGPKSRSYLTRYLSRRLVPTVMGFDPLWQFLHESDAVAAFKVAIDRDAPGVFNVVGDGVLPLSTVVKLAGRVAAPVPRIAAKAMVAALWLGQLAEGPPALLDYLQYLCVADGERAKRELGFRPVYTTREALLDFASAQYLRDARLSPETSP
jgi:UDP-glucose 4-epimerase